MGSAEAVACRHRALRGMEVRDLAAELVTAATDGWLQRGNENHQLSVDFMVANFDEPGRLMPSSSHVHRIYSGCVPLLRCWVATVT